MAAALLPLKGGWGAVEPKEEGSKLIQFPSVMKAVTSRDSGTRGIYRYRFVQSSVTYFAFSSHCSNLSI